MTMMTLATRNATHAATLANLDTRALAMREASDEKVAAMTARLDAIEHAKLDGIVSTDAVSVVRFGGNGDEVAPADRVGFEVATRNGAMRLRILDGAHEQIAAKTEIPLAYYRRMLEHAPDLAVENVQRWFRQEPAKRLVRMLGAIDDNDRAALGKVGAHYNVRAVLSDRYRPLDNTSLVRAALDEFRARGAFVTEWALDERRFFVRAVNDPRSTADIVQAARERAGLHNGDTAHRIVNGRDVAWVNERVAFGVALRNSETGHSALDVDPFSMILRCLNGLIVAESLGVRHVGRRHEEDAILAADTRRLDDAATFLKVRDRIRETFSEEAAARVATAIEGAAAEPLALGAGQPMMEFVGNVGRRYDLGEQELDILREEVAHETAARPLTKWALAQGMTATARRIGDEGNDFSRRTELERAGWALLNDSTAALAKAATAAVEKKPRRRR